MTTPLEEGVEKMGVGEGVRKPTRRGKRSRNANPVTKSVDGLEENEFGLISMEALFGLMDETSARLAERDNPKLQTPKEDRIEELSADGINDTRYQAVDQRTVVANPAPAAFVPVVEPMNVTHVPISVPKPMREIDHVVPVVKDATFTDVTQRDLSTLTRGANQGARKEGNLAQSVLNTVGYQEADQSHAPLMGLVTRVLQALACAETGATAARAPNVLGWDVQLAALTDSGPACDAYRSHLPLYIPNDMSTACAVALASLMVPGGAGAYGWRYRPAAGAAAEPRAAYMPSYARWLHPGGMKRVLTIIEHPPAAAVFGGAALNLAALRGLESYFRQKFGNGYIDQGWKAVVAAGHVYVDPAQQADPPPVVLGEGFGAVTATATHAGTDLRGADFLWVQNGVQAPGVGVQRARYRTVRDMPGEMRRSAIAAMNANAVPVGGPVPNGARIEINPESGFVSADWTTPGVGPVHLDSDFNDVADWIIDNANNQPLAARRYATAFRQQADPQMLAALYDNDARETTNNRLAGFRNIFGYADTSTLAMPAFDMRRSLCLIAGVVLPAINLAATTVVGEEDLRARLRRLALKQHVVHSFVCAGMSIWPDDIESVVFDHGKLVASFPRGLNTLCYVSNPMRTQLAAPNWQVLEPVHYLQGGGAKSAYYGTNVPGTWYVSDQGEVEIADPDTNFPALEAAVRNTWMFGGTVQVVNRLAVNFQAVIDANGLIAPLSFAPYARAGRRVVGVAITAGNGQDVIARGTNTSYDTIYTR